MIKRTEDKPNTPLADTFALYRKIRLDTYININTNS